MDLIQAGSCFLFRESSLEKYHLHIVLTDPEGDPPTVVIVMVRSMKTYTDSTLILVPGDHPFIKQESSVHYSSARRIRVQAIIDGLSRGLCVLKENASRDLLDRARAGLLMSPHTVIALKDQCRGRFAAP